MCMIAVVFLNHFNQTLMSISSLLAAEPLHPLDVAEVDAVVSIRSCGADVLDALCFA